MGEPEVVTINILDKEYRITCGEGEREALIASAYHLDARMKEIRSSGKVVGMDRIAVMAALNIAHEFLQLRSEKEALTREANGQIRKLHSRIEAAVSKAMSK